PKAEIMDSGPTASRRPGMTVERSAPVRDADSMATIEASANPLDHVTPNHLVWAIRLNCDLNRRAAAGWPRCDGACAHDDNPREAGAATRGRCRGPIHFSN